MDTRHPKPSGNPLPLIVSEEILGQMFGNQYGDIVTLGREDNPARDIRLRFPVPSDQRFVLTRPHA